jgi:hypothetical protein
LIINGLSKNSATFFWEKAIQMGERIGRIGQMETDFSCHSVGIFFRDSCGMTTKNLRENL